MLIKTPYSISLNQIDQAIDSMPTVDFRLSLNSPTGNFFYDPWEVKPEFQGTAWEAILSSLPFDKGEARIIKLGPGTSYLCHADIDDRWHLALTGNQSYLLDFTDQKIYPTIKDGSWYEMDAGKLHTAGNFGQIDRYQLVVRKLLINSRSRNLLPIKIKPAREQFDYRYQFDNLISPWLNRVSKEGYLSNFKYKDLEVTFDLDESQVESLNKIVTDLFEVEYE
jgi:hypothetical protein